MKANSEEDYRRVRSRVWLALSAVWVFIWFIYLKAKYRAEIVALPVCGEEWTVSDLSCSVTTSASSGLASANYSVGLTVAILSSVFLFFPSRILARWHIRHLGEVAAKQAELADKALQIKLETEREARIRKNEAEAEKSYQKIQRTEIIQKMGSISDLMVISSTETRATEQLKIRLGVAQALRDLTQKYDVDSLRKLINSDEVVKHTVTSVTAQLAKSDLHDLPELLIVTKAAVPIERK